MKRLEKQTGFAGGRKLIRIGCHDLNSFLQNGRRNSWSVLSGYGVAV
jgi:hypothetical protein